MPRLVHRFARPGLVLAALAAGPAGALAQQSAVPGTIVIATQVYATMPIPTLMEGADRNTANSDVADQLFLRLAIPGPGGVTPGDKGYVPMLARSWQRRDSLTLVFELDPRARWHDGQPVTARDVVFAFDRAKSPEVSAVLAGLLRHVASVTAEGERRVVVRFTRAYGEQFYDATWHVQPLPAHLLAGKSSDEIRRSPFAAAPVGNGPYRWVRGVAGQSVELAAVPDFFLGRAGLGRVLFRVAGDPGARLNLLLSGEADAIENVLPPLDNVRRLEASPTIRPVRVPSPSIGYLLFNQRARGDTSRPHPILSDSNVRRALVLALDRQAMAQAVWGPYAQVPVGPVSQALWIRRLAGAAAHRDLAGARRLLAASGWRDSDGDGILDRNGEPLALRLQYPAVSAVRKQMALMIQAQYREAGIRLDVVALDGPVFGARRNAGDFDIDFSSASQDPTPAGLTQSWTCRGIGGSNVAHYCDPRVDSLIDRAIFAPTDPAPFWRAAIAQIEADAPAAFLYASTYVYGVHRRYDHVHLRQDSPWLALREWTVRPGQALPRDRETTP